MHRAGKNKLDVPHLPQYLRQAATNARAAQAGVKAKPAPKLDEVLEQVERRMIELALKKTKGDQTAAAELLGLMAFAVAMIILYAR